MGELRGQKFLVGLAGDDEDARKIALADAFAWLFSLPSIDDRLLCQFWYAVKCGLWKVDGVFRQHEFCRLIASFFPSFPAHWSKELIFSFFRSMAADWQTIDKWRIEKFMVLVRHVFEALMETTALGPLIDHVLELQGPGGGIGFKLHFLDVVIPTVADLDDEQKIPILRRLMEYVATTDSAALIGRLRSKVVQPVANGGSPFFTDRASALSFARWAVRELGKVMRSGGRKTQRAQGEEAALQARAETLALLREGIAVMVALQRADGEPAEAELAG